MKSRIAMAFIATALATPMIAAAPARAQYYDRGGQYDYGSRYDDRGDYGRPDRHYYRGQDRSYYGRPARYDQSCRRSRGTTGLLAGGAGGALIGSALGGGTLGTLLGAVGGGLLGKKLDQRHDAEQNYRNGC